MRKGYNKQKNKQKDVVEILYKNSRLYVPIDFVEVEIRDGWLIVKPKEVN